MDISILALTGFAAFVAAVVQALIVFGVLPQKYRTLAIAVGSIIIFAIRVLGEYFGWDLTTLDNLAQMLAQLILMLLGAWFGSMSAEAMVREFRKAS